MSENQYQKESKNKDVEVGELFSGIGKLFSSTFGALFRGLANLVIGLLMAIKDFKYVFGVAVFIGLSIGAYKDFQKDQMYSFKFVIEPNFYSVNQVYADVDYYNMLVESGDHKNLAEALGVSEDLASYIEFFEVTPHDTKLQKARKYADLVIETDSLVAEDFNFPKFDTRDNEIFESMFYEIKFVTTKIDFPFIGFKFIENINSNEELIEVKESNLSRAKVDSAGVKQMIDEIVSLRASYKEAIINSSNNNGQKMFETLNSMSGASEGSSISPDVQLFKSELGARLAYSDVLKNYYKKQSIVRLRSRYRPKGKYYKDSLKSATVKYTSFLFLLVLSVVMIYKLNIYLEKKKNQ